MNKKNKLFLLLNTILNNREKITIFICWIIWFFTLYTTRHYNTSTVFCFLPYTVYILIMFVLYFNAFYSRKKVEEIKNKINKNMVLEEKKENSDLRLTIHKRMEKEKSL